METQEKSLEALLRDLSQPLDYKDHNIAMILAAGHGKRIKSETPKMLHKIWGVPTVLRVSNAARDGLHSDNQIILVGIKAREVAEACGRRKNRVFEFQAEQLGTGHAVGIGLQAIEDEDYDGTIYIFPGDVGLLTAEVVAEFRQAFEQNPCDMMVLTSVFRGEPYENYYGRIIRVPARDMEGLPSGSDEGKVIEIKEHKDILSLSDDRPYITKYNNKRYAFTRDELLELREFNTGVYAFKAKALRQHITALRKDNVQGELYVTDLISIYNQRGLSVRASATQDDNAVLGFNVKSVLKQMENIAREAAYEKLKDTITIEDKDDFFIADEVIEQILKLDRENGPLDIVIGKGAHVGPHVKLAKRVVISSHANLTGNIVLGDGAIINSHVVMSTYPHQTLKIGAGSQIYFGSTLRGNITIGEHCHIESGVRLTGSDDDPTRVGDNVLIKGTTYIFGCVIEDDLIIEHSVLKNKYVQKTERRDGSVQSVRWVLPQPQGLDTIYPIEVYRKKQ